MKTLNDFIRFINTDYSIPMALRASEEEGWFPLTNFRQAHMLADCELVEVRCEDDTIWIDIEVDDHEDSWESFKEGA